MTSIHATVAGVPTPGTQTSASPADTGAQAQAVSFDPLPFVEGSGVATSPNAQRLTLLGMKPPMETRLGSGDASSDSQAVVEAAARPFNLAEVSAMFLEFMLTYRQAARLDRQSSLEGQMKELLSAAQKTRDAAEATFSAALAQGIASIVGGLVQGVVGVVQYRVMASMKKTIEPSIKDPAIKPSSLEVSETGSAKKASSGSARTSKSVSLDEAKAGNRASGPAQKHYLDEVDEMELFQDKGSPPAKTKTARQTTEISAEDNAKLEKTLARAPIDKQDEMKFQYLTTRSQLLNTLSQTSEKFIDGTAKVVGAVASRAASRTQAESQEHEANAKKAEAAYSASNEEAQTAREAFNKVLDMVAEIDRSRSETNKSIARI